MAALVRVASGFHLPPRRKSKTGVAPICRTEMDRRHHQRFGAAMDLSEAEGWREEFRLGGGGRRRGTTLRTE
jgi:hypothetical protein